MMPTTAATAQRHPARVLGNIPNHSLLRCVRGGLIVLLAAVLSAGCAEPTGPDGATPVIAAPASAAVPDSVAAAYRWDAARLAVRHVLDAGGPQADSVLLPEALVESLHRALLWVYTVGHPARDSVVEPHAIHTFWQPRLREALVELDTTRAWARRWWRGEQPTGDPDVDALIADYDLSVARSYDWNIGSYIVLRSAEPLNIAALSARLERIDGVLRARQNGALGDGDDIRAARAGSGWRLDYARRWGDCPAGCVHERRWRFTVDEYGNVTFRGVWSG